MGMDTANKTISGLVKLTSRFSPASVQVKDSKCGSVPAMKGRGGIQQLVQRTTASIYDKPQRSRKGK